MNRQLANGLQHCLCAAALLVLSTGDTLAAPASSGPSVVVFLAQLVVLLLVGRLLGEAMRRIGQPSVMGQLLAGILLGPAVFGWLWPDLQQWVFPAAKDQKAMLDGISQLGVLLLLLLTGMEVDLNLARKVGRAAVSISLTGVAVPFICGVALGWYLPESLLPDPSKRLLTALFLGTALSISSIKIVAAVVRELNFARRNLGQVIVAAAIMEDTIGWIIIAITFSLAAAGTIDLASVAKSLAGTAAFLIASFTVGRRLVFYLIRWANDNFQSDFPVVTMILLIMGAMALTTHFIGVHTVLGAFVAGVLIGDSPILTKHIDEQLRGLILAFFMPVFFGSAGLSTDLAALKDPELLLLALALIAVASLGKFIGAFVGGEIGGLTRREALALACGMNARGSTEIIVASIGLSMGALTQNLFTMIVTMAVVTTMAMPPMLRWALARVPIGKAEKERLKREEIEAKGFVPDLERLLLAVDDSANGRFASRLTGLLAGPRGIPVTVLRLAKDGKSATEPRRADSNRTDRNEPAAETAADAVKSAADSGKGQRPQGDTPPAVALTVRKIDTLTDDAIATEARKGYGLFVVGVDNTRSKSGDFHPALVRITSAFDGPLAIVAARGIHLKEPDHSPLHILVPVNGTDVSRRAAEVAVNIARVVEATITALYVSNPKTGRRQRGRRDPQASRHERAILDDIAEVAEQYKQKIRTTVRSGTTPDQAILSEIAQHSRNLIVMGINRRPGEKLFFGDTATAVFEHAPISVVFLST